MRGGGFQPLCLRMSHERTGSASLGTGAARLTGTGSTRDLTSDWRPGTTRMWGTGSVGLNEMLVRFNTVTGGSNTFQMKYRVGSSTGNFDDRHLIVMAL